MKLGIISLVSDIHDPEAAVKASKPLLDVLKDSFSLMSISAQQSELVDLPIVLIETGGTEHKFKAIASLLKHSGKPVTLLATGSNNSLPAAMEILTWLNDNDFKNSLLLHGPTDLLLEYIKKRAQDIDILFMLKKTRIGVIGKPSDWLIAGAVDDHAVFLRWGVRLVDIPLEAVEDNAQDVSDAEAAEVILPLPAFQRDVDRAGLLKATKIYLGVKKTLRDYELSALTLRCFDLLQSLKTTGCLALSMLNDEGVTAGCEGDVQAAFTMVLNRLITGKPSFMANPSRIDVTKNTVTAAHCTVPTSMVESFGFRTHFESGIGVGIAGKFTEEMPIYVSKVGGTGLDRFYCDDGNIISHKASENLCRTQLTVKMKHGVNYFLTTPLSNHHIFAAGKQARRFKEVMALVGAKNVAADLWIRA